MTIEIKNLESMTLTEIAELDEKLAEIRFNKFQELLDEKAKEVNKIIQEITEVAEALNLDDVLCISDDGGMVDSYISQIGEFEFYLEDSFE